MFFIFPEDARWNAERQAVEFGVVIGEYEGVVLARGACFNACCKSGLLPSGASKRTTYSGRVSSALPSASSAGANWQKTVTSSSPEAICTRAPPRRTPEGTGLSRAGSHATRRLARRSLL
jgi:hypothetical protein